MPDFAFLLETPVDLADIGRKLEVQRMLGTPYTDAQIAGAAEDARAQAEEIAASLRRDGIQLSEVGARSEAVALIAYLQSLGRGVEAEAVRAAAAPAEGAR
jgi:cytochrome c oxidase cbb3-type subunit 2